MKLYFAGSESWDDALLCDLGIKNRLKSYFYLKDEEWFQPYDDLFLDSGAFSADSQDAQIDIDKYTDFILQHQADIEIAAALDVIGSAEQTKENFEHMLSRGAPVIPTFHIGSDFKYLRHYAKNYPYIAIGGMVGRRYDELDKFLRLAFYELKKFWPVKVHGFGVTNLKLLKRYPFYSVDSTSWCGMARYANSRVHSKKLATVKAKTRHYTENLKDEIAYMLEKEDFYTRLWAHKGITWNNENKI